MSDGEENGKTRLGRTNIQFDWRISVGNVLTMMGGVVFAAVVIVSVTRAFDSLQQNVAVLSQQVIDLGGQFQNLRDLVVHDGHTSGRGQ